jgi:GNAT superfamily N-acetyltransferase
MDRMTRAHIRALGSADAAHALTVINTAAQWYREFLPADQHHGEEMSAQAFEAEARRMTWYGAFLDHALVAVMGLERVEDVALVRHGYVLPTLQRSGLGGALLAHLEREAGPVACIIVGTYAANYKARANLEKAGYTLSPDPQAVLRRYFNVPADRASGSVTYEKTTKTIAPG